MNKYDKKFLLMVATVGVLTLAFWGGITWFFMYIFGV